VTEETVEKPIALHLRTLRDRAGQSIRQACDSAGLKTPSAWKHYEDDPSRTSMPADLVIELLRSWEGKGDPAITTEDVLQLSPNLLYLFKETGHHFNTSVGVEKSNVKVEIKVEARELREVRAFMRNWVRFIEGDAQD